MNRSKFTKEEVLMQEYQSLNHTKWDCKYHVVWIPKYRKKTLYGTIKKQLVPVIRELARQKECGIGRADERGHLKKVNNFSKLFLEPRGAIRIKRPNEPSEYCELSSRCRTRFEKR